MSQADWSRTSPMESGIGIQGRKPSKTIPVPLEYRRKTLARERDGLIHDLKIKTDCEVIPRWAQGRITQFDIFSSGSGTGVEKAVRHINHWISNARIKSKESSAWAKMPAFDANKWYYEQVEEMESERREKFKGPAPSLLEGGLELPSTVVDWPEELNIQSVTPRDVFGNKLEALDRLRMQDEVFITLLPSQDGFWQIKISALEDVNVDAAKIHLRTMIQKTCTEINNVRPVFNMILDEREGIDIVLESPKSWWPNRTNVVVPHLLSSDMMNAPGDYRQDGMYYSDLSRIQNTLKSALKTIQHKKGAYDFVIRLGCLALDPQKVGGNVAKKMFRKEQFLKDVNDRLDLDVKKWLVPHELGVQILNRLVTEEKVLNPIKSNVYYGYAPATLKETRPVFRGVWVFRDPTSPAPSRQPGRPAPPRQSGTNSTAPVPLTSLYVVQVDWTDNEDGTYEKTDTRYYKLEEGKYAPNKNLDINLLELGESRGWQFALESLIGPLIPRTVSPILIGFAQRVRIKLNYDTSSAEVFTQWDTSAPTIKRYLLTGRFDKVYSFGIQETCYKVELTTMWYPGQKFPVWGLAVRHTGWAIHLAELERLPVGQQAEWGNVLSTFFPDDGQMSCVTNEEDEEFGIVDLALEEDVKGPPREGIQILIDKLMQLSGIISSVVTASGEGVNL